MHSTAPSPHRLKKVTIAEGGVLPHIAPELLKKPGVKKSNTKGKAKAKKGKGDDGEDEYAGVPGGLGPGLKQEGSSSDDKDYMAADGQQEEEDDTSSSSNDESAAAGNEGQQMHGASCG